MKEAHRFALSKEYRARLIREGKLTVAQPGPIPANPSKEGAVRRRGANQQTLAELLDKRAQIPPLCSASGCREVSYHYGPENGQEGDHYGRLCPKHKLEAAERQREYKAKREQRKALLKPLRTFPSGS